MDTTDPNNRLPDGQAPADTRLWRVLAASVRGTSHERTGQPCQDAHYWRALPGGVMVAGVADGAGSAPLGEVGAALASRVAVESVARVLTTGPPPPEGDDALQRLLRDALKAARDSLEAEAAARQVPPRDLATTLILVIAAPEGVAAAQVGDGAAVVADATGDVIALTTPQAGEYINETTFLISPAALEKAQISVWPGRPSHVGVVSDGLQMLALKMPPGTPHRPFFTPLFRFVSDMGDESEAREELVAFLRSPRITQRTDDDLTLLLATLVA